MNSSATDQENKIPQQQSVTTTHPRLYHYTGEHAFRSIVGGNSLWSTYFEDMNDASEFRHMRKPLDQAMADRFVPVIEVLANANPDAREEIRKDGGTRRAAERVARILSDILFKVTFKQPEKEREQNSFVTSFCTHPEGCVYRKPHPH
jgi:hypothetical protein